MQEPKLTPDNHQPFPSHYLGQLGYDISDPMNSIRRAFRRGFDLVQDVKQSGESIRTWAERQTQETQNLIARLNSVELQGEINGHGKMREPNDPLWEIAYHENELSRIVRQYFGGISNIMIELKKLNPPLNSTQLAPFMTAMLSDRRLTLTVLEPISKSMENLTSLKNRYLVPSSSPRS